MTTAGALGRVKTSIYIQDCVFFDIFFYLFLFFSMFPSVLNVYDLNKACEMSIIALYLILLYHIREPIANTNEPGNHLLLG